MRCGPRSDSSRRCRDRRGRQPCDGQMRPSLLRVAAGVAHLLPGWSTVAITGSRRARPAMPWVQVSPRAIRYPTRVSVKSKASMSTAKRDGWNWSRWRTATSGWSSPRQQSSDGDPDQRRGCGPQRAPHGADRVRQGVREARSAIASYRKDTRRYTVSTSTRPSGAGPVSGAASSYACGASATPSHVELPGLLLHALGEPRQRPQLEHHLQRPTCR